MTGPSIQQQYALNAYLDNSDDHFTGLGSTAAEGSSNQRAPQNLAQFRTSEDQEPDVENAQFFARQKRKFWPLGGRRGGYQPLQGGHLFAEHTSSSRYIRSLTAVITRHHRKILVLVAFLVVIIAVILFVQQVSRFIRLASNVASVIFLGTLAVLILVLLAGYLPADGARNSSHDEE